VGRVTVLLDEMGVREASAVTTDDLRLVTDALWSHREARTRAKVTSIIRSWFEWCVDERLIDVSLAAHLEREPVPRPVKVEAEALTFSTRPATSHIR
jgi:site-specific recombinase XerD